jgi:hypothetical protein
MKKNESPFLLKKAPDISNTIFRMTIGTTYSKQGNPACVVHRGQLCLVSSLKVLCSGQCTRS